MAACAVSPSPVCLWGRSYCTESRVQTLIHNATTEGIDEG